MIIYSYRLKLERAICAAYWNLVGRQHSSSNLLHHLHDASYFKSRPCHSELESFICWSIRFMALHTAAVGDTSPFCLSSLICTNVAQSQWTKCEFTAYCPVVIQLPLNDSPTSAAKLGHAKRTPTSRGKAALQVLQHCLCASYLYHTMSLIYVRRTKPGAMMQVPPKTGSSVKTVQSRQPEHLLPFLLSATWGRCSLPNVFSIYLCLASVKITWVHSSMTSHLPSFFETGSHIVNSIKNDSELLIFLPPSSES